jgi:hypothetical protein
MLKNPSKYERVLRKATLITSAVPPALLVDESAGRIARELWWKNL